MPWCQILVDDPARRDERSLKRLMRNLPVAGDLIDVDEEKVVVTSVTLVPPNLSRLGIKAGVKADRGCS